MQVSDVLLDALGGLFGGDIHKKKTGNSVLLFLLINMPI